MDQRQRQTQPSRAIRRRNGPARALASVVPSSTLAEELAIVAAVTARETMATLLAKNADVLVTMDGQRRELRNAGLFARDGVIEKVGPTAELPDSADLVLDLKGHILLPGLINCHHHLDQILTRNLPAGHQPVSLAAGALPRLGEPDAGRHPHGGAGRLRRAGSVGLHDGVRPRLCLQERLQGR
jgi:hypothetical protein